MKETSESEWDAEGQPERHDLGPILDGWDYRPGEVVARTIRDAQGRKKIQMRIAMGVIQMEAEGRPDGQRPGGHESLLECHEARLIEHRAMHGGEEGFALSSEECDALRDESLTYYYRYLCLYQLQDFAGVGRDTARNLRVLDLIRRYAREEGDRRSLERYRPYILMMNARARAYLQLNRGSAGRAMDAVRETIVKIKACYEQMAREIEGLDPGALVSSSAELDVLRELLEEIGQTPAARAEAEGIEESSEAALRERLRRAVEAEDYERAASLRDQIRRLGPRAASDEDASGRH